MFVGKVKDVKKVGYKEDNIPSKNVRSANVDC